MSNLEYHRDNRLIKTATSSDQNDHETSVVTDEETVNEVIEHYLDQLLINATELIDSDTSQKVISPQDCSAATADTNPLSPETVDAIDVVNQLSVAEDFPRLNWDSHRGVDCLLFDVRGLKLAVPLCHLGSVSRLNQTLTPIPGQASWCLGVYRHHDQSIVVVDSARFLMPERCQTDDKPPGRYLLQLANQPWALSCQGVLDTQGLKSDVIKWRGSQSKRPWLAGTVITEMCALLDVSALVENLQNCYWQNAGLKDQSGLKS